MLGTVRTKQKCPKCGGKFVGNPLHCSSCLTTPARYFLDLSWPGSGRIKIYSGKDGHPLDSYERADRLLTAIRYEIDRGNLTPKNMSAGSCVLYVLTTTPGNGYGDGKWNCDAVIFPAVIIKNVTSM